MPSERESEETQIRITSDGTSVFIDISPSAGMNCSQSLEFTPAEAIALGQTLITAGYHVANQLLERAKPEGTR